MRDRALLQPQADPGPVRGRPPARLVVQVEHEMRAGDTLGHASREDHGGIDARLPSAVESAGVTAGRGGRTVPRRGACPGPRRDARAPAASAAWLQLHAAFRIELGARLQRRGCDHHVMDDRAVARDDLRRFHPHITLEGQLDIGKLPRALALGRHFHLRRFDDHIGWPSAGVIPSLCKLRQRGHVAVIAPWRARIHPRHQLVDLGLAQAAIVPPFAMVPLGVPRGHLTRDDLALDRAGPRPHFVVRPERHRRDLARPMARDALGVHDRSNVLPERRPRGLGRTRGREQRRSDDQADRDVKSHHDVASVKTRRDR